jgi:hypothetical protein
MAIGYSVTNSSTARPQHTSSQGVETGRGRAISLNGAGLMPLCNKTCFKAFNKQPLLMNIRTYKQIKYSIISRTGQKLY